MFIYARNKECDLGPIYTITNIQHIRIYPGKLKFILVKISPDPGRLHGKHAKENQTLFMFLRLTLFCENYYFTKKITNLRRKSRVKVQKSGVKVQKSGVKVHITNLRRKLLFHEENYQVAKLLICEEDYYFAKKITNLLRKLLICEKKLLIWEEKY